MVEFSAEQVNYIGVGLGFAHFYGFGGSLGAHLAIEDHNRDVWKHGATPGEHYWAQVGMQLYAELFQ